MIFRVILAVGCLLASAAAAEAARIRDLSLSPEESLRQPNMVHNPAPLGGGQTAPSAAANTGAASSITAGHRFMDGYCDASIRPESANALQECLQQARADACDRFRRLPVEAQGAADLAISCANALGDPRMTEIVPPEACRDNDRQVLLLLKKYWGDQDTSHALLFLPDMVNNPAAGCAG